MWGGGWAGPQRSGAADGTRSEVCPCRAFGVPEGGFGLSHTEFLCSRRKGKFWARERLQFNKNQSKMKKKKKEMPALKVHKKGGEPGLFPSAAVSLRVTDPVSQPRRAEH